jgi:hypothetical protein
MPDLIASETLVARGGETLQTNFLCAPRPECVIARGIV